MSEKNQNSLVTTASGIFGGLSNIIFTHVNFSGISLEGVTEVTFYAAISAVTGYFVKLGIDIIKRKFRK